MKTGIGEQMRMRNFLMQSLYKVHYNQAITPFFAAVSYIGMHNRFISIRAHIRGKIDFNQLKASSDMLPISVGQPYHEGEQFFATTRLVNENFSNTKLVLADTLQRHNIDKSDQNYQKKVDELIKEGDKWLERNKEAIRQVGNIEIKRWNYYLTHKDFESKKFEIDRLYDTDPSFMKAVDSSVSQFLKRKYNLNLKNITEKNHPKAQNCIEYIKEECAVLLLWFDIEKSPYLLYPNKVNPAIHNLIQRKTAKMETPLFTPLLITFKTIKEKERVDLGSQKAFDMVKEINLDKNVLEKFCRRYFSACISTYHDIDSTEDANKFLIKTLVGLSSFLDEVNVKVVEDTQITDGKNVNALSNGLRKH